MAVELKVPESANPSPKYSSANGSSPRVTTVEKDEALVEVETDKATLEVPASVGGTLTKVLKNRATPPKLARSSPILPKRVKTPVQVRKTQRKRKRQRLNQKKTPKAKLKQQIIQMSKPKRLRSAIKTAKQGVSPDQDVEEGEPEKRGYESDEQETSDSEGEPRIMPAAQRLLEENGISADQVEATGPGGRLLKEDVQKVFRSTGRYKRRETGSEEGNPEPAKRSA